MIYKCFYNLIQFGEWGENIMKKICIVLASVFLFIGSNAIAATTVNVFDSADTTSIDSWKAGLGGIDSVLEDFEGISLDVNGNWYETLPSSDLGTFTAGGLIGEGTTSYNDLNDPDSDKPWFRVTEEEVSGRLTGNQFLDSADITELTLDITPDLTNLWFHIQDPSDQSAITTITSNSSGTSTDTYSFTAGQANAAKFFVGISVDGGETLKQIIWKTSTQTDGYGLDNFTSVSAVPIPGAALLLASGLLGLGWVKRRSKSFSA